MPVIIGNILANFIFDITKVCLTVLLSSLISLILFKSIEQHYIAIQLTQSGLYNVVRNSKRYKNGILSALIIAPIMAVSIMWSTISASIWPQSIVTVNNMTQIIWPGNVTVNNVPNGRFLEGIDYELHNNLSSQFCSNIDWCNTTIGLGAFRQIPYIIIDSPLENLNTNGQFPNSDGWAYSMPASNVTNCFIGAAISNCSTQWNNTHAETYDFRLNVTGNVYVDTIFDQFSVFVSRNGWTMSTNSMYYASNVVSMVMSANLDMLIDHIDVTGDGSNGEALWTSIALSQRSTQFQTVGDNTAQELLPTGVSSCDKLLTKIIKEEVVYNDTSVWSARMNVVDNILNAIEVNSCSLYKTSLAVTAVAYSATYTVAKVSWEKLGYEIKSQNVSSPFIHYDTSNTSDMSYVFNNITRPVRPVNSFTINRTIPIDLGLMANTLSSTGIVGFVGESQLSVSNYATLFTVLGILLIITPVAVIFKGKTSLQLLEAPAVTVLNSLIEGRDEDCTAPQRRIDVNIETGPEQTHNYLIVGGQAVGTLEIESEPLQLYQNRLITKGLHQLTGNV